MESIARKKYETITQTLVQLTGLLVNPKIPWLGYSPGGIIMLKDKIIEIKCPTIGKKMSAASMIDNLTDILKDEETNTYYLKTKDKYQCQVHLRMFICNVKKCDLVLYSSYDNNIVIIPVNYNESLVLNQYLPILQFVYFSQMLKYISEREDISDQEEVL